MTKLPYSRLETTGDNAVDATRLRVSSSDLRTIEQALIDAGSSGGGGGADLGVEFRTITALENTNKELTLTDTPGISNKVVVFVVEGSTQYFGIDYTVTGDVVSWDTLGMDGLVEEGTRLVIIYPKSPSAGGGGSGGELTRAEIFTVDSPGMVGGNKYVDLNLTPTDSASVRAFIIGGSAQINDELDTGNGDFEIIDDDVLSPKRFSWDNLGMEAQLSSIGTKFLVVYTISTAAAPEAVNVQTDPFTGNLSGATEVQGALDIVDALNLSGGSGAVPKVEYFVTDGVGTVDAVKYLDLANTPSDPSAVKVILVGGAYQLNAELNTPGSYEIILDDFSNLRRINWDGFSMESALIGPGIYIAVEYYINQATATQASDILTSPFTGSLSGAVDVQEALNTIDSGSLGGGGVLSASDITTTAFTGSLSGAVDVQEALNTIDSGSLGGDGVLPVSDLTALAAIDTTGFVSRFALVNNIGIYSWVSGSALTADGYTVIDSDVYGQWHRQTDMGDFAPAWLAPDIAETLPAVTATLDFPSIDGGNQSTLAVTVPGARAGDFVILQEPDNLHASLFVQTKWVSAKNTVSIRLRNLAGGANDLPAATWRVLVSTGKRIPPITAPGIEMFEQLLGGAIDDTALEALLADGQNEAHFRLLVASRQRMQALLDNTDARAAIEGSAIADGILTEIDGVGY